jgi:hypothetical protein
MFCDDAAVVTFTETVTGSLLDEPTSAAAHTGTIITQMITETGTAATLEFPTLTNTHTVTETLTVMSRKEHFQTLVEQKISTPAEGCTTTLHLTQASPAAARPREVDGRVCRISWTAYD